MTAVALVLSLALTLLSGLIRAAGASLLRTSRADALHDAAEGDERAAIVAELLDNPPSLQPALAMVLSGLLILAALTGGYGIDRLVSGPPLMIVLALFAVALLLVGDVLARHFGRSRPRRLAYGFAGLLRSVITLGRRANDLLAEEEAPDEEELEPDEQEERELISSILEFTDTIVREVMVPRPDMITIGAADSTDAALDLILAEGRSRVPVVGEGIDDVVGILYARDLLKLYDEHEESRPCRELMRPAHFVPETKQVSDLLREMQHSKVHLVIVLDEFGGTAGLITIEDLLEEIVGEIVDEYDVEEPLVQTLDDGGFLVDARLSMYDLQGLLERNLPDEEWDTVGGLMLGLAGRVPREGESFEFESHVFTAERVQGRRVSRVRIATR